MDNYKKQQYQDVLRQFAQEGNRFAMIPRLTAFGKAAGLSAEEIIEDARALGVKDRDADIRRMWMGARVERAETFAGARTWPVKGPVKRVLRRYAPFVDELVAQSKEAPHGVLMALSPVDVQSLSPQGAAKALLEAMFAPEELILVGTMRFGVRECQLRRRDDWLKDPRLLDYQQVKINPFTGRLEAGGKHGQTRLGNKCIASYRYVLLEFDNLSLDAQEKFWCSVIRQKVLPVVAIVYSAKKSFHGLVAVGAQNFDAWKRASERLQELFCSATDPSRHADTNALTNPGVGMRLAGAMRREGKEGKGLQNVGQQVLHYLNPSLAPHTHF